MRETERKYPVRDEEEGTRRGLVSRWRRRAVDEPSEDDAEISGL